jgi:glycosyltransferase involved in cell wall biosynthesis
MRMETPILSVIIPLLNESGNLALLQERLALALAETGRSYEIIYIDDGSTDDSLEILRALRAADEEHIKIISFGRNFGKTTAMVAGFQAAHGELLITLDADLQDDPAEIPQMLAPIEQGYDLVVGWRKERMDRAKKKLSSRIYNTAVARLARIELHDMNCGFKVYRRAVIENVRLYSGLHRYVPVLAAWQGFLVTEQVVQHHPRHAGDSKYGTGRAAHGFMDLVMVLFITRYLRSPLRLFGWLGFFVLSGGGLINLYLALLWFLRLLGLADVPPIGTRPLFSVGILAMILGVQLISLGLLGEMIRYFTYRPQEEYVIKQAWL